ncbi:hypothetical protein VIGAN_04038100, partial [Vigna angularis var. angularis]
MLLILFKLLDFLVLDGAPSSFAVGPLLLCMWLWLDVCFLQRQLDVLSTSLLRAHQIKRGTTPLLSCSSRELAGRWCAPAFSSSHVFLCFTVHLSLFFSQLAAGCSCFFGGWTFICCWWLLCLLHHQLISTMLCKSEATPFLLDQGRVLPKRDTSASPKWVSACASCYHSPKPSASITFLLCCTKHPYASTSSSCHLPFAL